MAMHLPVWHLWRRIAGDAHALRRRDGGRQTDAQAARSIETIMPAPTPESPAAEEVEVAEGEEADGE